MTSSEKQSVQFSW